MIQQQHSDGCKPMFLLKCMNAEQPHGFCTRYWIQLPRRLLEDLLLGFDVSKGPGGPENLVNPNAAVVIKGLETLPNVQCIKVVGGPKGKFVDDQFGADVLA